MPGSKKLAHDLEREKIPYPQKTSRLNSGYKGDVPWQKMKYRN